MLLWITSRVFVPYHYMTAESMVSQVLPSASQLARPLTQKRVVLLYDTGQRDPVLE